MNMWLAAVFIVAIVMAADTLQKVARAKVKKQSSGAETEAMQERINGLEERIRVLERIITEDKHDLRREISRL